MAIHKKSTFEIWQRWAGVLYRQLQRIGAVYQEHGQTQKLETLHPLSEKINLFIAPLARVPELAKRGYAVQGAIENVQLLSLHELYRLFSQALVRLPHYSADMQTLLQSPCVGNCRGRQAIDIFKGPHRSDNEGIADGLSESRGSLPWQLQKLIDEADAGGEAYFLAGLGTHPKEAGEGDQSGEGQAGDAASNAQRHTPPIPRRKLSASGVQ